MALSILTILRKMLQLFLPCIISITLKPYCICLHQGFLNLRVHQGKWRWIPTTKCKRSSITIFMLKRNGNLSIYFWKDVLDYLENGLKGGGTGWCVTSSWPLRNGMVRSNAGLGGVLRCGNCEPRSMVWWSAEDSLPFSLFSILKNHNFQLQQEADLCGER